MSIALIIEHGIFPVVQGTYFRYTLQYRVKQLHLNTITTDSVLILLW